VGEEWRQRETSGKRGRSGNRERGAATMRIEERGVVTLSDSGRAATRNLREREREAQRVRVERCSCCLGVKNEGEGKDLICHLEFFFFFFFLILILGLNVFPISVL
jgi:hypothetical protein